MALPVTLAAAVTASVVAAVRVPGRTTLARRVRILVIAATGGALLVALVGLVPPTSANAAPAALAADEGPCPAGAPEKRFDVQSLDVDIPLNRFGDHDPKGRMYALSSRIDEIRSEEASRKVSIGLRDDAIQPLVIRANGGDCVDDHLQEQRRRRRLRTAHRRAALRRRQRGGGRHQQHDRARQG